jgi:hypothetical protein
MAPVKEGFFLSLGKVGPAFKQRLFCHRPHGQQNNAQTGRQTPFTHLSLF